jgi:RHS repeat-associated protein
MEDIKGNIQSYKYDDFNNISFMVDISNGKIEESKYSYDINNRLILKESDIKELNTQHRMEYDREGNLIKKEEALREGNEFIGSKTFEYNYDGYNRLSIVKDPMKRFTEYSYNNLGLRSNKKIGNEEINYLYNGDQIVLETYKDGLIKAKNIRGRNLIYRQVNEKELYYLHNERGDVIKLLDDKGSLVKNYEYDPYGNEDITNKHQDRNIDNPFRYAGEYLDEETGNYYLRARYYNPEIQRFISEDQVKGNNTNPLTYNLYGYCEGNPIRYVDTSGNYPIYSLYPQVGARGSKIQEIVDRKVRKEEVGIEYSVKKTAVGMYYISSETTSIGLSFSPVGDIKDIQEAVTGVDLVTGEKLEADERAITIVAAALPWINAKAARMALKLNKGIKRVTKIGKKTRNFVNIKNKVLGNIRTGSALKLDAQHAFDDIVDNYATYADKFELIGGDGVKRELYQIEGSFNGKKGIFEWVVDSDKKKGVTHRRFIDGVGITGKPNARSKK